jgi:Transposase DDE domain group 1
LLEREGLEWFCRMGGAIDGRRRDSCEEITLDIDSSEDPTHGQQELAFFNGHYDSWMYHPLFIFEGGSGVLLSSRLRPGNVGGVRQLLDILRPTVRRLRARFPKRPMAIRADGDFAKAPLLDYAEYAGCSYVIGMPRNSKLEAIRRAASVGRILQATQGRLRGERTVDTIDHGSHRRIVPQEVGVVGVLVSRCDLVNPPLVSPRHRMARTATLAPGRRSPR